MSTQTTDTTAAAGERDAPAPGGAATAGPVPGGSIPFTERPEALVGAAFAGGLLAALILKRLGS